MSTMFDEFLDEPDEPQQELGIVELSNAFTVKTDADYTKAAEFVKNLKAAKDEINAKWEPLVKSAFDTHKKLKTQQNEAIKPLEEAEKYLRGQMSDFMTAKERARMEAERKLREEREAEQRRLQAEADRIRREQEAADRKAREEADRLAAAGRAEEAEKAREAARIAAEKRDAEIQMKMDAAAAVPVASVQNSAPQVDGVSYTTEYEAMIVDDAAVPMEFNGTMLRPVDMKAVNALVKASKGKIIIPGIRITEKKVPRVRA